MWAHLGALSDEAHPRLDHGLPFLIVRMRLAGENELHRTVGIGEQAREPLRVV